MIKNFINLEQSFQSPLPESNSHSRNTSEVTILRKNNYQPRISNLICKKQTKHRNKSNDRSKSENGEMTEEGTQDLNSLRSITPILLKMKSNTPQKS